MFVQNYLFIPQRVLESEWTQRLKSQEAVLCLLTFISGQCMGPPSAYPHVCQMLTGSTSGWLANSKRDRSDGLKDQKAKDEI